MAGNKGLSGESAAKYADRSKKGNVFKPLPGVASPHDAPTAEHRKLKSGVQKALKDAGLAKRVHLAFRYYKNLDVAGSGLRLWLRDRKKEEEEIIRYPFGRPPAPSTRAAIRVPIVSLAKDETPLSVSPPIRSQAERPAVGLGYRTVIDEWTRANLARFDLLEITVDHCLFGGEATRAAIYDLVGRIPLTAHGIGMSIGTDEPLDLAYLDQVAAIVERLGAPAFSEHLAFTRVAGRDLARLLPLPKSEAVAELIIAKVRTIQSHIPVPFLLENIAYVFDWPERELSDVEFLTLICRETGAGILLDVENLHLNGHNHGVDPYAFIDALPVGVVREVHVAGGETVRDNWRHGDFLSDSHNRPIPDETLDLLVHTLSRHAPTVVVLERDDRIEAVDEIRDDLARIRARLAPLYAYEHVWA